MTSVIHIRNSSKSENEIYIGRDKFGNVPLEYIKGYWGNPVVKAKICPGCKEIHTSGGDTLVCYKQYLIWRIETDESFKTRLALLKDKVLVCYCKPKSGFDGKLLCHGQIIAGYLDDIIPELIP